MPVLLAQSGRAYLQWQVPGDWVLHAVAGPNNREHPLCEASGDWVPHTVAGPNKKGTTTGRGGGWGGEG